ncbi:hypothetical protein [Methylibium petroleiphilum]|uniref:hypothetical protein n=1 Tax=Methylibium petroleiphilum TaxID=105560 RepID=UPI003D28ECEA
MSAVKPSSGLLAATLLLGACATPVALPPHVSTRSTEAGAYLDRIDLSYASPSPQDFARLKLCVAETISNDSVGLKDVLQDHLQPGAGAACVVFRIVGP